MTSKAYIILLFIFLSIVTSALVVAPPPNAGAIDPYFNGIFPTLRPGEDGSWELENTWPNLDISSPLRIIEFPGSSDLLVLNKLGQLWKLNRNTGVKTNVLDIRDRAFTKGEAGVTGIALHPDFDEDNIQTPQYLYLFYRFKPNPTEWSELGFNRLSKFPWDKNCQCFDTSAEEILIQQYDRSTWHNGGGMFFGPDGFLYVTFGDEGAEEHQQQSTQTLSGGIFSGVIRIDIDNNLQKSHPIRRQPIHFENPQEGWGNTYTQGYSIPNDNPWQSQDSTLLEEFVAIGLRSPYSTHYDKERNQLWISDVGSDKLEEINKVSIGDNLQWPYMEGTFNSDVFTTPASIIGTEKGPFFEYDRSIGSCIIGGGVYHGLVFSSLREKFLFADYVQNRIMALPNTGTLDEGNNYETLIPHLGGLPFSLPDSPGITGVHILSDGEILVTVSGKDFSHSGRILKLKQKVVIADPPLMLSELGVFDDMMQLIPTKGMIPYTVNAPLWSDGAIKKRWIVVPNDGIFDSNVEQIVFDDIQPWSFPKGTVFVKHFELPITNDINGPTTKLETRFFIITEDNQGYGLTYKWNNEGTDALLLGGGTSRDIEIFKNGVFDRVQTWDYPSRDQCLTCHNQNASFVLGVNSHQLNGTFYYPEMEASMNQLDYLNGINIFDRPIKSASSYLKSHPLTDGSIDLEQRIRSYMDANCASCHRLGGVPTVSLDLRYSLPLKLTNSVNYPTQSQASDNNHLIIEPGNAEESELWIRDASLNSNKMPPIGRNLIDQMYIDSLSKWIGQLPLEGWENIDFLMFPNPTEGWLVIKIPAVWSAPVQVRLISIQGEIVEHTGTEDQIIYMDLNSYPSGTYFIELSTPKQRKINKLVIQ